LIATGVLITQVLFFLAVDWAAATLTRVFVAQ